MQWFTPPHPPQKKVVEKRPYKQTNKQNREKIYEQNYNFTSIHSQQQQHLFAYLIYIAVQLDCWQFAWFRKELCLIFFIYNIYW